MSAPVDNAEVEVKGNDERCCNESVPCCNCCCNGWSCCCTCCKNCWSKIGIIPMSIMFGALIAVAVIVGVVVAHFLQDPCAAEIFDTDFVSQFDLFLPPLPAINDTDGAQCYQSCYGNFSSSVNFRTWLFSIVTDAPVLYPYYESELQTILENARLGGCKVRVSGAGHSEDGFIVQLAETINTTLGGEGGVVIVNLANYIPPDEWNDVWDDSTESLRISAGKTWLNVMAQTRPRGYLMQSQTAGVFFTVAGVLGSPNVHGATFSKGQLNNFMTACRVMLANGTVVDITEEEEVKAWRGSMGMLGIILAAEIKMQADGGLLMNAEDTTFTTWDRATVEANLKNTFDNFDASEWFIDPYADRLVSIRGKYNVPELASFNFTDTKKYYDELLARFPFNSLGRTGGEIDPLNTFAQVLLDIATNIGINDQLFIAKEFMAASASETVGFLENNNASQRDLYYVDSGATLKFYQMYSGIQCVNNCIDDGVIFDVLDATRNWVRNLEATAADQTWFPTMVIEFRLINVQPGMQLLENWEPGYWLGMEIITSAILNEELTHLPYLHELEQIWISQAPLKNNIHVGKAYAYGPTPDNFLGGMPFPFQNETMLDNVFNQTVKDEFVAKMDEYDPDGLFRAGALTRLLGISDVMYSPRGGFGATCAESKDCVSDCCCTAGEFACDFLPNTCVDVNGPTGTQCGMNCQCASGQCSGNRCT